MNCEIVDIAGIIYIATADDSFAGSDGSTWYREAHAPLTQTVSLAQAEMDIAVRLGLTELANAERYTAALETRTAAEEDLEIITSLWDF